MKEIGFSQPQHDHCLFTHKRGNNCTYVLVYVDDILITGSDVEHITHVKRYLNNEYSTKGLGSAKFFLGIEIARSTKGTHMSQGKHITDILKHVGMTGNKLAATPLPKGIVLSNNDSDLFHDP